MTGSKLCVEIDYFDQSIAVDELRLPVPLTAVFERGVIEERSIEVEFCVQPHIRRLRHRLKADKGTRQEYAIRTVEVLKCSAVKRRETTRSVDENAAVRERSAHPLLVWNPAPALGALTIQFVAIQ